MHTAGSVSIDVFKGFAQHYGILYPLQTFTKNRDLNFDKIPLLIEAGDQNTLDRMREFALRLSGIVLETDSDQRKQIHLAAVFACNFTNHMLAISEYLLQKNGLPYELLKPLINETFSKAVMMSPHAAQTGPAVRGNTAVLNKHLAMLEDDPDLYELYRIVSRSIGRKDKS